MIDEKQKIINAAKLMLTNTRLLTEFLSMMKLATNITVAGDLMKTNNNKHFFVASELFINNFQEVFLFLKNKYFADTAELKASSAEKAKWTKMISGSAKELDYMRILRNYSSHYIDDKFSQKLDKIKENFSDSDDYIKSFKKAIYILVFNDNDFNVKEKMISLLIFIDSIVGAYIEYVLKLFNAIAAYSSETEKEIFDSIQGLSITFSVIKDELDSMISNFDKIYDDSVVAFNEGLKEPVLN